MSDTIRGAIIGVCGTILGVFLGTFLGFFTATLGHNRRKWREFQERVSLIRMKYDRLERCGIEGVVTVRDSTMHELLTAVYCVRPYISFCKRHRLDIRLESYCTAHERKGAGFLPEDSAGMYRDPQRPQDTLSDVPLAIKTMGHLLDDLAEL